MRFRRPSQDSLLGIAFMVIGLLLPSAHVIPAAHLHAAVIAAWVVGIGFNALALKDMYARRKRP